MRMLAVPRGQHRHAGRPVAHDRAQHFRIDSHLIESLAGNDSATARRRQGIAIEGCLRRQWPTVDAKTQPKILRLFAFPKGTIDVTKEQLIRYAVKHTGRSFLSGFLTI